MKRLLLALPFLLAGCGGGGGLGTNNDFARSYSGTYTRALASAPTTVTASGIARYVGVRRTVEGDAGFTLSLGDGSLGGTVTRGGRPSGVTLAYSSSGGEGTGTETVAVTDLRFDRAGNVIAADFSASRDGVSNVYSVRLARG